jgi:hypothetical protein
VIFLTMGTQEPFDRLVRAVDLWYGQSDRSHALFGQIAEDRRARYEPSNFVTALSHGKPIVVMPRLAHLREHRNDHQLATVKQLRDRPGIHVAEDETKLGPLLDHVLANLGTPREAPIPALADSRFTDALRSFLTGQSTDKP